MAEEQKAEATPVAPKKKPIMLIVIILAVALAAGGGVYFFVGGQKDTAAKEEGKEGKKDKKSDEPKLPAQYVKLEPFVVNFEAKGLMRYLQVTVEVMTRDPGTVEVITKNDPMIRNDLLLLLGNQQYESISTREGKEALRAQALDTVKKIIDAEGGDPKKVEQLFFTSFVMQ